MWQEIRASLSLDATAFQAGVKRAESSLDKLGRSASGTLKNHLLAAFSIAGITAFARKIAETGDRIADMSEQLGVSIDEFQQLEVAAGRTGKKTEDIAKALDKVGVNREAAVKDNQELLNSFNKLGISAEQLKDTNLSNLDILKLITASVSSSGDRAAAVSVLGKGGAQLLSTVSELKNLGPIPLFKPEDIKAIDQLGDLIKEAGRGALVSAVSAINPQGLVQQMKDNQEMNKELSTGAGGGMRGFLNTILHKGLAGIGYRTDYFKQAQQNIAERNSAANAAEAFDEAMAAQTPSGAATGAAETGGDITEKNKAALLQQQIDLRNAILDTANKLATTDEKNNQLLFQRAQLLAQADATEDGTPEGQLAAGKLRIKAEQLRGRIAGDIQQGGSRLGGADHLQQVGGFVGMSGSVDPALTLATSQLHVLEEMDAKVAQLVELQKITNALPFVSNSDFTP